MKTLKIALLVAAIVSIVYLVRVNLGRDCKSFTPQALDSRTRQHDQAVEVSKQALQAAEHSFGPDNPEIVPALNNLAQLYRNQGKYELAEPLYQRALAINEKAFGPDSPSVIGSLENLAELYEGYRRTSLSEFPLTVFFQKRILVIEEKALGHDHPAVGSRLGKIAEFYTKKLRGPFYERQVAIYDKALDPNDPVLASSLDNLADAYIRQNKFAQAEPLYERLVAIFETKRDPNDQALASLQMHLADVYQVQAKFAQAEELYDRAQPILEVNGVCNALGKASTTCFRTESECFSQQCTPQTIPRLTDAQHATLIPLMREFYKQKRAAQAHNNPIVRALKEGKITQAEFAARYSPIIERNRSTMDGEDRPILYRVLTWEQFENFVAYRVCGEKRSAYSGLRYAPDQFAKKHEH